MNFGESMPYSIFKPKIRMLAKKMLEPCALECRYPWAFSEVMIV